MITALLLPMALGTAGIAMDLTHVMTMKSELQNSADAAALAAASAMSGKGISEEEAKEMAEKYLAAQMMNLMSTGNLSAAGLEELEDELKKLKDSTDLAATEKTSGTAKTFDVTVNTKLDIKLNPLSQLLGFKTVTIGASSKAQSATESKNALSMYLVLDRSGSMAWATDTINSAKKKCKNYYEWNWGRNIQATSPCYVTKIETLKIATANLTSQLNEADPDNIYVRTAAVSYSYSAQKPTDFQWGTTATLKYVENLDAEGGTASTDAVKAAYTALSGSTEDEAHQKKNGQIPSKYIVFMTDGDNNSTSDDTKTINYCNKAKEEGMEIFSVAFMAPDRGRQLLKNCATDDQHFYTAKDASDLVAAFKQIGEKASQAMTRLTN